MNSVCGGACESFYMFVHVCAYFYVNTHTHIYLHIHTYTPYMIHSSNQQRSAFSRKLPTSMSQRIHAHTHTCTCTCAYRCTLTKHPLRIQQRSALLSQLPPQTHQLTTCSVQLLLCHGRLNCIFFNSSFGFLGVYVCVSLCACVCVLQMCMCVCVSIWIISLRAALSYHCACMYISMNAVCGYIYIYIHTHKYA
jgi:hypothetical protein